MSKHALVTGAAGFIGSHLVEHLVASGWMVSAAVHQTAPRSSLGPSSTVEWFHGDVCKPETFRGRLERIEYIFHVAGAIRGGNEQHFDRVNHVGTARLLDVVDRECRSLRRFVYVSSLAAGGPTRVGRVLEETTPSRPIDMYGRSKLSGELQCLARRSRIPITIVRPPMVLGPRDRSSYQLFRLVRNHVRVVLRGPERIYSWIYIADLVEGLVRAATTPLESGEILYLTAPTCVGWGELQRRIARILGVRTIRVAIPYGLLLAYGAVAETIGWLTGRLPLIYRDKARQARAPAWTCDGGKAERLIGFRATTDLDLAVAESVAWYTKAGWR